MSKIAKALERAKLQRGEIGAFPPVALKSKAPELSAVRYDTVVAPNYSVTKVQQVESDVLENNRILYHLDDPYVADYYNFLRTQVLQRTRDRGWNALMVTSPGPGEGKTLTSINLAMSLAREAEQTALLVDTNLRNPKISQYLDLKDCDKGLPNYLLDENSSIPELLVNPGINKLVLLPTSKPMANATDILASPRMKILASELKTRYPDRYVIYDCPHVINMPEALVFATYVDAIILVVEADRTKKSDLKKAMDALEGRNILGIVMNKTMVQ